MSRSCGRGRGSVSRKIEDGQKLLRRSCEMMVKDAASIKNIKKELLASLW